MWPVSADWLAALGRSHGRYTRLEVWFDGEQVAEYQPMSGQVQVTARNRIRRTLSATLPESAYPGINPDGSRLMVYQGLTGANGALIGAEIPVFAGRLESASRQRKSGTCTVTASDPMVDVNDAEFDAPRAPRTRTGIVSNIALLITEVHPDAHVWDQTGSDAVVAAGMMWQQDRGQAIDDLAASIGAEVFARPDGKNWVIRPIPKLGGVPVWTLTEGQGGVLVRDTQSKSRADVANRMVVRVEQPGGNPIVAVVTDDMPASPTRYGGPYGVVVRTYGNNLISSYGQAQAAALGRLARYIGANRTREVDTPPNPALEGGDLLAVSTEDGAEQHIADSFGLPLAVTDVMTIQTRSTGTSVS